MEKFITALGCFVKDASVDCIFPMTDATSWPISRHRQDFGNMIIALPPHESLELVSDKQSSVALAQDVGISVPTTVIVRKTDDLDHLPFSCFPLVMKDRFSIRWEGNVGFKGGVDYAYTAADLREKVSKRLGIVKEVLVQEFVPGDGIGFSALVAGGEVHLPFQWKRIREKDPRGSGSSSRKAMVLDSDIRVMSEKILLRAGFEGIGMVEYKESFHDRRKVFMEINGRPWGSIQLPIHCGIDYPKHMIKWLSGRELPSHPISYNTGITSRLLSAELVHLENVYEGSPRGWPLPYPALWKTLLKISIPWYPGLRYDDISISDPVPGFVGVGNWILGHLRGR